MDTFDQKQTAEVSLDQLKGLSSNEKRLLQTKNSTANPSEMPASVVALIDAAISRLDSERTDR